MPGKLAIWLSAALFFSGILVTGSNGHAQSIDFVDPDSLASIRKSGDSLLLAETLLSQARFEKARNHIKPSIQAYQQSISILEKRADTFLYNTAITELAEIYLDQTFLNEAQEYLEKSADYFRSAESIPYQLRSLFLLSRVYIEKDLLDKAERTRDDFVAIMPQSPDTVDMIRLALIDGLLDEKRFNFRGAVNALYKAYELSKKYREAGLYTQSLMELGRIHLAIGQTDKAIVALSKAEMVNSLSRNYEQLKEIYSNLSRAYELEENYEKAYGYLYRYSRLNDSLLNEKRQEIINRLNIRYEAQQKQLEIISLANEKRLADLKARNDDITFYSLVIGFVGVLIAAFFTILYYQQRLRANQIISEQNEKINQSRINELKNSVELESMQSMIQGQEMERDRIAKDLHDSLGGLLSSIKLKFDSLRYQRFNGSSSEDSDQINQMLDTAIHEVRDIASNLTPGSLQKLGLIKAIEDLISKVSSDNTPTIDFQYYGMDIPLSEFTSVHCYRIIQELLINSIKHSGAEEVLVQMTGHRDHLSILVEDDGMGYDQGSATKGMGTDNILSRVRMLNGDIHVETAPGQGTSTLIQVPLQEELIRENT